MNIELKGADVPVSMLIAAVVASTIGVLTYNVLPLYIGSLQDSSGFGNAQIGWVASAFFLGFNAVSASSYFWVRRVPIRRSAAISVALLGVFLFLSMNFMTYSAVLLMTVAIGGVSGALTSVTVTLIAESKRAARWYGLKAASESAAGVLLLFLLPATLTPMYGFKGTVFGMLAFMIVLVPGLRFLAPTSLGDNETEGSHADTPSNDFRSHRSVWLALVATATDGVGGSAIWTFEERIAKLHGFDAEWAGRVLGFSLIFAVVGPIIAGAAGQRFGNRSPYAIAGSLAIVGVYLLALPNQSQIFFALGASAFMLGWGGGIANLYASVAVSDPNGRHIALVIPAIGIGSMIGPALAGSLFTGGSLLPLQSMAAGMIGVSMILVWLTGKDRETAPL